MARRALIHFARAGVLINPTVPHAPILTQQLRALPLTAILILTYRLKEEMEIERTPRQFGRKRASERPNPPPPSRYTNACRVRVPTTDSFLTGGSGYIL